MCFRKQSNFETQFVRQLFAFTILIAFVILLNSQGFISIKIM